MKTIVIEDKVYSLTERQYKGLKGAERVILDNGNKPENDWKLSNWISDAIDDCGWKLIGSIDFDFRL